MKRLLSLVMLLMLAGCIKDVITGGLATEIPTFEVIQQDLEVGKDMKLSAVVDNKVLSKISYPLDSKDIVITPIDSETSLVEYYVSGPNSTEIELKNNGKIKKRIYVSSKYHVFNITAFSTIPEGVRTIEVLRIDNTTGIVYDMPFKFIDEDKNGKAEKISWVIPHLSDEEYEISIEVLNPYEYLRDGDVWNVMFNTSGIGNLTISSPNANWTEVRTDITSTADEMIFMNLYCGGTNLTSQLKVILQDDSIRDYSSILQAESVKIKKFLFEDYECNYTGNFSNYMNIAGYATLLFEFNNANTTVFDYAYDPINTDISTDYTNILNLTFEGMAIGAMTTYQGSWSIASSGCLVGSNCLYNAQENQNAWAWVANSSVIMNFTDTTTGYIIRGWFKDDDCNDQGQSAGVGAVNASNKNYLLGWQNPVSGGTTYLFTYWTYNNAGSQSSFTWYDPWHTTTNTSYSCSGWQYVMVNLTKTLTYWEVRSSTGSLLESNFTDGNPRYHLSNMTAWNRAYPGVFSYRGTYWDNIEVWSLKGASAPVAEPVISLNVSLIQNITGNQSIWLAWNVSGNYTNSTVLNGASAVYNGTATTFNITGLTNNTAYAINITIRWNSTLSNSTAFSITTLQNTAGDSCDTNTWDCTENCDVSGLDAGNAIITASGSGTITISSTISNCLTGGMYLKVSNGCTVVNKISGGGNICQ